ncbi:hypothetical protein [Nocardiopsis flavescens]|uniref:hypothetical protein n=1 Tax=Nocardiopsis flavescens TaxID=758803 RepID=UPI0011611C25|nr:hypothetical protein [Nocardiopsis flavescens]
MWTTTGARTPGATILVQDGRAVIMDHGMDMPTSGDLLSMLTGRPGLTLVHLVWLGWNQGLSEAAPEHVPGSWPAALPASVDTSPGLALYRVGAHQAVAYYAPDAVVIAGDLLAPGVPELSGLTLAEARDFLLWARGQDPQAATGSRGVALTDPASVGRAIRTRLAYLETLEETVRDRVRSSHTARDIWCAGTWRAWPGDPRRHLINVHAAIAHVTGVPMDADAVRADLSALAPAAPASPDPVAA